MAVAKGAGNVPCKSRPDPFHGVMPDAAAAIADDCGERRARPRRYRYMKKLTTPRKLHVNAEAIRLLATPELQAMPVVGATGAWGTCLHCECATSTSCPVTK